MTTEQPAVPVERVGGCPICCDVSGEVRHSATTDRWFGVAGSWMFRQCTSCSGLWLDPRPTTAGLPLLYENYYTHGDGAKGRSRPSAWRKLRAHLPWHASDRRGEVGYLNGIPPGRVLDVGCGDGALLGRMAVEGWSVVGVDLDGRAVEAARASIDGDVQVGTIQDIKETASFDAIILFHVLEHVDDPLPTLLRVQELLRPGGVLSITTPNAASWLHRLYGHRWRGLEPPRHLQIFAEPGLRRILGEAGFTRPEVFTTARNAALLACASERSFVTRSFLMRTLLAVKGELLQAIEWGGLRWSPYWGEELVALVRKGRVPAPQGSRLEESCE